MAQAARTYYGYSASSAVPKRSTRTPQRPDVRVIPGRNQDHRTLNPQLVTAFKLAIALLMVMAVVCGIRVWFSVSTVQALENIEALESSIDNAYATGHELEIKHAVLASPERIQTQAKKLGMGPASKTTFITVPLAPKIAKNENGAISVAGTIANIQVSHSAATAK